MPKSPRAKSTAAPPRPGRRARDFAEVGADWFWEKDAQLRFVYMSTRIDDAMPPFSKDFLGKRIDEIALPGFDEVDWRPLLRALERRVPFRDFRIVRRTAHGVRHMAVSGMPLRDAAGRFQGYRGTARDISKEAHAEERAATAQARLVDAIESIPESFMLFDRADRLVLCNNRCRDLHAPIADLLIPGVAFEAVCRASAALELPWLANDDAEGWVRERIARHRAPEFVMHEQQIGDRWFQISEQRMHDGGSVVIETEITAVKRREQELAEKTALLRGTLDHMEQGLLVVDADLRIKIWNERWIELLAIPRELVGVGYPTEPLARLAASRGEHGPGDVETLVARHMERLRRGDVARADVYDATGRAVEVRRSRMPDGGILFTFADISERKRVEVDLRRAKEEAEMASRSKTEFLANMSHELRTPLNAVIGFSDILASQIFGPLGDQRYSGYARDIRDSGLHLLNLINDVLDVSKVEFGKVELIEEAVDVAAVVESCVRLMRNRAEAAGLRLTQELPEDLPRLEADGRRLKQILLNLLSNAVKFTPGGGRVTLRVTHGADGVRLIVEDTGIGIDPADLEKAMRPFGQIDSRLARKYQGTGLGLPLARSMAELHGGKLAIDSVPGRGTTVILWLPPSRVLKHGAPLRAAAVP